ncbi:unnamed protein product, partial [Adineta steineri]
MVRKKSVAAKVKTQKKAYQRRIAQLNKSCSWRVLVVVIQAAKKFLRLRKCKSCFKNSDCHCTISKEFLININYKSLSNKTNDNISFDIIQNKQEFDDVKNILRTVVSKVCRLDYQRKRQSEIRKRKRSVDDCSPNESVLRKRLKQNNWFNKKYNEDLSFRQIRMQQKAYKFRDKYKDNNVFRQKQKTRLKKLAIEKYTNNDTFREHEKTRNRKSAIAKYNNNEEFREKQKTRIRKSTIDKYNNNKEFREKEKTRITKSTIERYSNNENFREKEKIRMKRQMFNRYHMNMNFRQQQKLRSNENVLFKYRNDVAYQKNIKEYARKQGFTKYVSDNSKRLKKIQYAINFYRNNYTPNIQKQRQLYNQRRRIIKKYNIVQSYSCVLKHQNLYIKNLKIFRDVIQEGPDYTCRVCGLALFRNQVIPYIEEKYITKNMSFEMKERIQCYLNNSSSIEETWICRSCSDKIKKKEMPSRAIVNKLEVSDVPSELKKLNDLEKHLIALRLPFMKIVNL